MTVYVTLIPLQLNKDFLCQNLKTKLINHSFVLPPFSQHLTVVVDPSWKFLPLSSLLCLYNRGLSVCLSSSVHLWCRSNLLNTSLTLLFTKPPQCIDCKSDLGGTEAGAEVRIRNKQLFCNSCYMRFKCESTTKRISIRMCLFLFSWSVMLMFIFFQLASQHPCDVTVLQQIDEESTCDNNPWTFK